MSAQDADIVVDRYCDRCGKDACVIAVLAGKYYFCLECITKAIKDYEAIDVEEVYQYIC